MDADVAITIAFGFEAFLVAVVGAVVAVHEARKTHVKALPETGRVAPDRRLR
jgi:hypothetical protein